MLKDIEIVYNSVSKSYEKKIIIGYSIGSGLATILASQQKADLLILQAPYDDFEEFSRRRIPYFPDCLKKFHFKLIRYLKKINCPIRIFHGDSDQLIRLENSYRLRKQFKKTDELIVLLDQGHIGINDNPIFQNEIRLLLN
ncbi:alpha/beta hydrolase family protein [Flavobacterium oreochromis]